MLARHSFRGVPAVLGALFVVVSAMVPPGSANPPAKGKCTDPPVNWTVFSTYIDGSTNAILPDAGGPYPAVIQICNGTGDAILQIQSPRQITYDFSQRLGGPASPSWAAGLLTGTDVFLHLHAVMYDYNPAADYFYTTRFGAYIPDHAAYNIRMWNPTTDALSSDPATNAFVAVANSPYLDSLVNVQHCHARSTPDSSGPCAGVTKEAWLVSADNGPTSYADTGEPAPPAATQVLGLVTTGKRNIPVAAGEFRMPFRFKIEMQ